MYLYAVSMIQTNQIIFTSELLENSTMCMWIVLRKNFPLSSKELEWQFSNIIRSS